MRGELNNNIFKKLKKSPQYHQAALDLAVFDDPLTPNHKLIKVIKKYDLMPHKTCFLCGAKNKVTLHHLHNGFDNYNNGELDPNSQNHLDNLVFICDRCHKSLHKELDKAS